MALVITTLLKTGAVASVYRHMKQIENITSEVSDKCKTLVVQATHSLCTKFPKKRGILTNIFSGMLRDEDGFDYKTSLADTIITVIKDTCVSS